MENKPTCKIDEFGSKRWLLNDILHREDGPAVEHKNGDKTWNLNGNLHRLDGPAIDCKDGTKFWFVHGVPHRLDGPAKIYSDGTKLWFINNIHITEEITKWAKELSIDLDNLSEVDIALIKIVWADYGK